MKSPARSIITISNAGPAIGYSRYPAVHLMRVVQSRPDLLLKGMKSIFLASVPIARDKLA